MFIYFIYIPSPIIEVKVLCTSSCDTGAIELKHVFIGVLFRFYYKLNFFIVYSWCLISYKVYSYSFFIEKALECLFNKLTPLYSKIHYKEENYLKVRTELLIYLSLFYSEGCYIRYITLLTLLLYLLYLLCLLRSSSYII